jgi:hypothetical protein
VGAAVSTLEMARRLEELPVVAERVRAGSLSLAQATEVASAAGASPAHEQTLVEVAEREPLRILQHHCRNVRASAAGERALARYRRIHETRSVRKWTDGEGAFRLDARLTPDAGARLWAALEVERDEVFRAARREGRREPFDAYTADALVALVTRADRGGSADAGSGAARARPRTPRATVHVRVDHAALVRGHVVAGETCEIAGVGPLPVPVVDRMLGDAVLKVLVTDGVDVRAVAHAGRTIPSRMRTALEQRDPVCAVPGCAVRDGLEIHHVVPFAKKPEARLETLARVCGWHHDRITYDGFMLRRRGDRWVWKPPGCREPPPP